MGSVRQGRYVTVNVVHWCTEQLEPLQVVVDDLISPCINPLHTYQRWACIQLLDRHCRAVCTALRPDSPTENDHGPYIALPSEDVNPLPFDLPIPSRQLSNNLE